MTVQELVTKSTVFLKGKNIESARLDAELLISKALKWRRIDLYLNSEFPVSEAETNLCREYIVRRGKGEPAAYILGEKEFYGQIFRVQKGVLVPRPETEHIVDEALDFAKHENAKSLRVLDLGVGSGCIGISILIAVPQANLTGVDTSALAIDCAMLNSKNLAVDDRTKFLLMDAGAFISEQKFDLVVANPPYISHDDPDVQTSVRDHEPAEALFSGEQGLEHIRKWLFIAIQVLRSQGLLLMEIGANQGAFVRDLVKSSAFFDQFEIIKDYSGRDRVLKAFRKGDANG